MSRVGDSADGKTHARQIKAGFPEGFPRIQDDILIALSEDARSGVREVRRFTEKRRRQPVTAGFVVLICGLFFNDVAVLSEP